MSQQININEIIEEIRRVNSEEKVPCLSLRLFLEKQKLALSKYAMLRPFDGKWTLACKAADVIPCEAADTKYLKPWKEYSKEQIREKLEHMARENPEGIIGRELKKYGLSMGPIHRIWGRSRGLEKACKEFGLKISPSSGLNKELFLEHLADEFLNATLKFSPPKIPTLLELSNRGSHAQNSYSGKWGGYPKFKELVISYLFKASKVSEPIVIEIFRSELEKFKSEEEVAQVAARPHEHGRMLGFRAFAHVPTYEQDVVGMFNVIADEIGFQIVSNRNAFPDCETNRRIEGSARNRYKKCLIEFELRSSDFKAHKHPVNGCDLIVCWEHNWNDCPLEVLELKSKIRELSGWK